MNPSEWGWPFGLVFAALFVIVMTRANGTYWVGRAIRKGSDRSRLAAATRRPGYRRVEGALQRWGAPVVSLCFLTIGVQTMVNVAAGATRMPLRRYLPAVTIGSVLWALIYSTVGFVGVKALAISWDRWPVATLVVGAVVLLALIAFVLAGLAGRRRRTTEQPAETPSRARVDHPVS